MRQVKKDSCEVALTNTSTRLPNLILVGVQKSGTTWMHDVLSSSQYIFGSEKKEVNFWGKTDCPSRLEEYRANFPVQAKPYAKYYLDSTPGYFQQPNVLVDLAQQIKDAIPDVRPMVILRNPVERYRSAYTHHIHKGRLEYTPEIDVLTDDHLLLTLGVYGRTLAHWQNVFPDIMVFQYEQIKAQPKKLMVDLFAQLKLPYDIRTKRLVRSVHTSQDKVQKSGWPSDPKLSSRLHNELVDYYRDDLMQLQKLVSFDVSKWLQKI